MDINYQLNVNELNVNFTESLKQLFKDKEIIIHVSDITDSVYLSQFPEMIKSIQEGIEEDLTECSNLEDIGWK